ncbi:MAG: amidase [Actinobacteria bacterium]|nr:amidase [Actinomycetota bacterium]
MGEAGVDAFSPALEQAAAIARGEAGAAELAAGYLERIERLDPRLNAYCLLTPELAARQEPAATGPLAGVAVSIKDLVPLAGHPYTRGSRAFRDEVAEVDAFAVARLKAEGLRILGKTTTAELGGRPVTDHGLHGAARNPWDVAHTAGGSSGGAAAAVAAGLCAIAHGSDGGGSVRIPAACCGVVGLKPSRGRISLGPELGAPWGGLLTDGVLARTVADAAAGLDAMAGHLPGDPYWADVGQESFLDAVSRPTGALRIAFATEAWAPASAGGRSGPSDAHAVPVDLEVVGAVREVAALCGSLGHRVGEGGPRTEALRPPQSTIFAAAMAAQPVADRSLLDPANALAAAHGDTLSAADHVRALDALHAECRRVVAFWDDVDVLITPTFPMPAPRVGEMGADPASAAGEHLDWLSFTYPANCTGQPAISLPLAVHSSGLPIGVQLTGPPRGDALILALGAQLEAARPWPLRPPGGWG